MNDIYEYKANKYKLKYLKLKREYIGGGSSIINKDDLKKLNIKDIQGEPKYNNNNLTGIFLNRDSYNKILLIKNHDPLNYNTANIEYIGEIKYNYDFFNTKYNIITKYFGKNKKNNTYYYIISETLYKNYIIDGIAFKEILNSLKTCIDNLIKNLYKNDYILNTINEHNMTFKYNKIYFYNYNFLRKIKDENEKNNDIKAVVKFIRWLFKLFEQAMSHPFFSIDSLPKYYGTLELLEQLYEDDENNKIYNPNILSSKLEDIINSIIEPNKFIDIDFIKQIEDFFSIRFQAKLDKIILNNDNDNDIVKYINDINKLYDTMYNNQYYKDIHDFDFKKIIGTFENIIKYKSKQLNKEKVEYINTLLEKTDYMIKSLIDNFINIIMNKIEIIYKTDINEDIYKEIEDYINKNKINKIDKNNEKYIKLNNFLSRCPSHKQAVIDLFNFINNKLL